MERERRLALTAEPLQWQTEALTDEEAVRRIVAGDAALFELLMRRHNQRIYRAVRAVLRSNDAVEDVMQQAYLNAYAHISQFAGGSKFSTWLTRIAVNEALAQLRKHEPNPDEGMGNVMEIADARARTPEQMANNAELRNMLENEVAALPQMFRVVLVMRDVDGMSTAEVAECLAISEDLVKTRLHRARAMLRDRLYRRAGVTLESIYAFGNARCDRVVAAVMNSIAR